MPHNHLRVQKQRTPELVCCDPDKAGDFWPFVEPLIRNAVIRGGGDFERVRQNLLDGPDLLWLAWDGCELIAAAITSVGIMNGEKFCTIVACGGDGWERFGHLLGGIESYARGEECSAMRIYGRIGWKRLLEGYRLRSAVFEKEI